MRLPRRVERDGDADRTFLVAAGHGVAGPGAVREVHLDRPALTGEIAPPRLPIGHRDAHQHFVAAAPIRDGKLDSAPGVGENHYAPAETPTDAGQGRAGE